MTGYGYEVKLQIYQIQGASRTYIAHLGGGFRFIVVRTLGFREFKKLGK